MHSPLFPYDVGMYNRIHGLYDETFFASPEEHFKVNAKRHEGKVVMPFIAIWRLGDFNINTEYYNDSALRVGHRDFTINKNNSDMHRERNADDREKSMHLLPVTLQYQIDIYATKRDVADGLTSELLMELKERPYIRVQIYDMGEYIKEFNLDVDDSVSDNSDIGSFSETNRFYRLTLNVNITSALIHRIDKASHIDKVYIDLRALIDEEGNSQSVINDAIEVAYNDDVERVASQVVKKEGDRYVPKYNKQG